MKRTEQKIYVLGASGFLGSGFVSYGKGRFAVAADRVDITDLSALRSAFKKEKPDVVINFAGVRAYPNIDWCETHKAETVSVNVAGAINACTAALEAGAYPIHISSGCVYSGGPEHAFTEDDTPNFFGSFYSRMKIALQESLAELPVLCARIRMPVASFSHPRNLIDKIASYKKVISTPNSVTLVEDLYPALERLIETRSTGVLNLTNEGYVEHARLLEAYKELIDPRHSYELITVDELERDITKAKRSNCVLSNEKAKSLGISMPPLDAVRIGKIMEAYKKSLKR